MLMYLLYLEGSELRRKESRGGDGRQESVHELVQPSYARIARAFVVHALCMCFQASSLPADLHRQQVNSGFTISGSQKPNVPRTLARGGEERMQPLSMAPFGK